MCIHLLLAITNYVSKAAYYWDLSIVHYLLINNACMKPWACFLQYFVSKTCQAYIKPRYANITNSPSAIIWDIIVAS